jgi:hypothetical protein
MRGAAFFVAVFAILATSASGLRAQAHPNFSGRWAATDRPDDVLTIAQDGSNLSITHGLGPTSTYYLDPARTTRDILKATDNFERRPDGSIIATLCTAGWDGQSLEIRTIYHVNEERGLKVERLPLDAAGNLSVKTTRLAVVVTTTTYKKIA